MNLQKKLEPYLAYLNLTPKERKKRTDKAEQDKYPKPNPQGDHVFPQQNFVKFMVKAEEGGAIELNTYRYPARQQPRAVILMFHGLNSYIGHGAHIASKMADLGFITVGFDHRGFGRSPGKPGKVISLEHHLEDAKEFVSLMRAEYPELPFFCMGLSMGGMTSYYLTLRYPELFEGAVLMAPALMSQASDFVVGLASVLKKVLPENTRLTKPIYGLGSRNPRITEDVKVDPCVFKERVHLSTAHMLVDTMDKSPSTFKDYRSPFLIVQGGLDKLVCPDVAFELFSQSQTAPEDKDILFYEKMWHDVWHEEEIWEILERMGEWLLRRLAVRAHRLAQ